MKKMFAAIALTIAIPAVAQAQAVTAAPKSGCCAKMKDMAGGKGGGMDGCKGMAKMDHGAHSMSTVADPHAGHDMSKPMAKSPTVIANPSN